MGFPWNVRCRGNWLLFFNAALSKVVPRLRTCKHFRFNTVVFSKAVRAGIFQDDSFRTLGLHTTQVDQVINIG